jgi:hypothetical protein
MICDFDKKSVIFNHENDQIIFSPNEIILVEHYMSYPMKKNRANYNIWDWFNYCKIKLEGDRCILITNLLVPDISSFLANMNIDQGKIEKIAQNYNTIKNQVLLA